MSKSRKLASAIAVGVILTATSTIALADNATADASNHIQAIVNSTQGLSPAVLKLALKGYQYAQDHSKVTKPYLTIVNLNMPSKEKRMWVIDLKTDTVLFHTLVAQGKNSGLYRATRFSNRTGSLESSLGVYTTANSYIGHDGYSMRIDGLEPGINSNALSRDIVMHPAWYVSPSFAKTNGRVGRSWGCFALDEHVAPKVISLIKGGSVIFAYAPQEANDPNITSV